MRKLSVCMFVFCLGFASITQAATVTKLKIAGNTAGGGISTGDDPCSFNFLSVQASEQVTRDGSTNTATKELMIFFFGSDSCQSLNYFSFVTVPLTVSLGNQPSVTLPFDILVDVTPFDSEQVTAQKRLVGTATISATSDFQKSRQNDITQNETGRQVVRTRGTSRDATINVSAQLDGVELNFVSEFGSADIGHTTTGTMEITRF